MTNLDTKTKELLNSEFLNSELKNSNELLTLDVAFEQTKNTVDKVLSTAPFVIRTYTQHLIKSRGKFIRAWALLVCAMDSNNKINQNAVAFASAIEILHLATLVHDDVMDDASLRRGVITLQKKYGKKTAVICGDYLLATALRLVTSIKNRDEFLNFELPSYIDQICMGELRQHLNNGNMDLSFYRYLSIINGKTAALFEASFYGGAILIEKEKAVLNNYRQLGKYVGMIFQLTDDCIDFEVDELTAKKNVQSDYEQGVVTLPLIYTFYNNPDVKNKAKEGLLTRQELNKAVFKAGGLDFTKMISKKYYDKFMKTMSSMDLSNEKKSQLVAILDKAFFGLKKDKEKKNLVNEK